MRSLGLLAAVVSALHAPGSPVRAQELVRTAVPVDYVGVEGVYLSVGTDRGLATGDTLSVFSSEADTVPTGLVVVSAASRSRSLVQVVAAGPALSRGDTIYLELRNAATDAATAGVARADTAPPVIAAPDTAGGRAVSSVQRPARAGPRMTGRFALQVDARETRTSWEGQDLFGTTRRRYATPVSTLALRLAELPGGFTLQTNLRASYRYSDRVPIEPSTSVRVYDLSVTKEFDSAPVQMRLGRFYNTYETYSGYWDGALLRVGGRSGGIGVAAGFDPDRSNEGFSRDVTKIAGFADLSRSFGALRYETDVSFHSLRPRADSLPDRTFAGWTQRIAIGRFDVGQRLRVDRDADSGEWSLAQLRVRGGVRLARSLRLNLGFGRTAPAVLRGAPPGLGQRRDEWTGGMAYFGGASSLSLDVGSVQWADDERGISVSGIASTQIRAIRLYAAGRHWRRGDTTSRSIGPALGFDVSWVSTRLGYQMYRTDGTVPLTSHFGSVELSARPTSRLRVTLRAEQQWGTNLEGTHLRLSVGRSF